MDALQRWLERRRASGLLAGFVVPAYVAAASLVVAAVIICAIWKGVEPGASDGCSLHVGAALSGSTDVFARDVAPGCAHLSLEEARDAILWDVPFAFVYSVTGTMLLWWLWPRAWRVARFRRARWAAFLPAIAGAFDLVEDGIVVAGLREGPSLVDSAARAAAVAGWWKWMLMVLALLATIASVCGAIGNRRIPRRPTRPPAPPGRGPVEDAVGVCLGGSGIRSTAFALGALRALHRHGLFRQARWVSAVAGGAYAATSVQVARTEPDDPNLLAYVSRNRRYLSTGRGGLPATIVMGALLASIDLAVLAAMVAVVAWPLGFLASTWAVQPGLQLDAQSVDAPLRLWLPGLGGLVAAIALWLVALFLWDPARKRVLGVASFFTAGGLFLLALLVGLPVATVETPPLVWAAIAAGGLAGWLLLRRLRVTKRFAGVPLALVPLSFGGWVAAGAGRDEGWSSWSIETHLLLAAGLCVFYFVSDVQSWSLFRLRHLRLRSTFATTRRRGERAAGAPAYSGVYPLSLAHEPDWPSYRDAPDPRLVVCAAARRGRGAVPFTFSDESSLVLRKPSRRGLHLGSVSAAAAMSGTPFAPRLGAWMPNPRYALPDRPMKRPRLGYLLKEVAGLHDADDPYVYVAGTWERLGLVELVRRRARWIVCVDGGDSFEALDESIALALAHCGAEIVIDVEPLRERDGRLPKTSAAVGVIRYHSCGGLGPDACETGLLFYGRATLAQDSPISGLSFSVRDGRLLGDDDFDNLVRLGESVGRRLALDYTAYTPPV